MANTGFKGLDVRQTGNQLVFRAFLQNSSGALLTSGTTTLKLYELQSDATIKSYDFNDNTFKTTALTTETLSLTHRTGNNSTTNTGVWTAALATLTGFTAGGIYLAIVNNSSASPTDQVREFQYGSEQGDLVVTANGTGVGELNADVKFWNGAAVAAPSTAGYPLVDVAKINNVATSSVTTINANVGTTQPVNFSGTGATAYVKSDLEQWIGTAPLALSSQQVQAIVPSSTVVASVSGAVGSVTSRVTANTDQWGGTAVASAYVNADLQKILGTAPTETIAGYLAGAFTTFFNVASPVFTTASVNQTGDSYTRIGATGSGLTSLAPASTALSTAQWTNTRAGYLDNLSAGAVALAGSAPSWYTAPVDVSANVSAIKAKTDQLTFTTLNKLDCTIQAAGDFAQGAADKVWSTAARTLTAFSFTVDTNANATETAIKAKTDNLPTDPADASDIAASFSTVNSTLSTIAGYVDTEVAAIKNLLEADQYIKTTTTPWQLVYIQQGTGNLTTGTALLTKDLKDTSGTGITSTGTIPGQKVAP